MKYFYPGFIIGIILVFCSGSKSNAQNLVPNYSFEVQDTCPAVSEITLAQPWNSPTFGSPDLFNTSCGSQQGSPYTGIGSAGFYTYSTFADNREYVQVQLNSPLVAGQTYDVAFYVKRLTFFSLATDHMGAYFTSTEQSLTTTSALTQFTPQVDNPSGNVLNGTGYTLISGSFVASGGEEYMIIGNFYDDANTQTQDVESNGNLKAYYYIDDISVVLNAGGVGVEEEKNELSLSVFPNPSHGIVSVNISQNANLDGLTIRVLDIAGRCIYSDLFGNALTRKIDLSSFEKGAYLIQVFSNEKLMETRKIILN
ncbi:MAG: T9SS type A sorting domain-containing protein [Crocinitomicaceae bacterium]|nr:T9SS type A sorting domain-containing protein [Crocinitomicaceae bacterium]